MPLLVASLRDGSVGPAARPGGRAASSRRGADGAARPVRGAVRGWLAAVVRLNGDPAPRSCLRRPRTGQARGRERSPGVSPPSATRCTPTSAHSLPQAGRQLDRDLRRPRPLSDELPRLIHATRSSGPDAARSSDHGLVVAAGPPPERERRGGGRDAEPDPDGGGGDRPGGQVAGRLDRVVHGIEVAEDLQPAGP